MKNFSRKNNSKKFWNKEYHKGKHFALSTNPSEDLTHFIKWLQKNDENFILNQNSLTLDLGTGNGRNLIYLAKTFGTQGIGYDISGEAINQAKESSKNLNIKYETRSIKELLPIQSESVDLVLDMMTSHYLNKEERDKLRGEIFRILKPGGWLFFKTLLRDGDINTSRLLQKHGTEERGSYIHPKIGTTEHVFSEREIEEEYSQYFDIKKKLRSHRHLQNGRAGKRRSISVYMNKPAAE